MLIVVVNKMYIYILSAALSSPYPPMHFSGTENVMFAQGVSEMVNYKKNELICFSDSAGTVMIMTISAVSLKPNEIEEIGRVFQKELDWITELDAWNHKYKAEFGHMGEYDLDDHDYKSIESFDKLHVADFEKIKQKPSQEQIYKTICDETFK